MRARWCRRRGDLLNALPAEVTTGVAAGDALRLDNFADLRTLLTDAEATMLARLAAAADGAQNLPGCRLIGRQYRPGFSGAKGRLRAT